MKYSLLLLSLFLAQSSFAIDRFCNGAPSLPHVNGGGNVALTAIVSPSAFVSTKAAVCEYAIVNGDAQIKDNAKVYGTARVMAKTLVSGNAEIFGNSLVEPDPLGLGINISGTSKIFGNARLLGSITVTDLAMIFDNSRVMGQSSILESAKVYGNATLDGFTTIKGNSKIHGVVYLSGDVTTIANADLCEGKYYESGTTINSIICKNSTPMTATNLQISVSQFGVCTKYFSNRIRCWGGGSTGSLGQGNVSNIGDDELPSSVPFISVGGQVQQITNNVSSTCAILIDGNVKCWGGFTNNLLGYAATENIGDNELPSSISTINLGGFATQISMGVTHVCVLLSTKKVRCWGINSSGQLGYPGLSSVVVPATAGDVVIGEDVTQIASGASHTCALLVSGNVRCWGSATSGQLGYGNVNTIGDNETPASAGNVSIGGTAIQIAVMGKSSCALLNTGDVRCWGENNVGQLGLGNLVNIGDNELPSSVGTINIGGAVSSIYSSSGASSVCAILSGGTLRCWGSGAYGVLGYGNTNHIGDNETPSSAGDVPVGQPVTSVGIGYSTCALLANGRTKCWGANFYGELGIGSLAVLYSPGSEVLNFVKNYRGSNE